ncbi:MAG TPA: TIGR04283 family arsenosugar biosynthesis glycosyltransferase [Burkholderiales bacterium]|nr:TIGR04283 family arsenosugar biosynthesis glycosyltransferase [Burkholderiales bacterium]
MKHVSIVVPVLNEAQGLEQALRALRPLRGGGHEVIVVDGGSTDGSARLAAPLADRVLSAERGRANQMNAGAQAAGGDVLLFLHADTRLPERAAQIVLDELARTRRVWGRFDVRIDGRHRLLRLVAVLMNLRSRLTGICTGDQAIFVLRDVFLERGGFPAIALMEDIALSRNLRRVSPPLRVATPVHTSARRWERGGVVRTIVLMWWLRLRYFVGASPVRLARIYDGRNT